MSTPMHEIARLCEITPPDVAVVLNVLPVHVEHLGSIENVAAAKAEIVEGMKPGGTAILNADDPRVAAMSELANGQVITYGIEKRADVSAKDIEFPRFGETTFLLVTPDGEAKVNFKLNGRHNILNALSAAAVGHRFGMKPEEIAERIATTEPPPQRGNVIHFVDGFTVINDSYNSNPAALMSMVKTLVDGVNAGEPKDRCCRRNARTRKRGRGNSSRNGYKDRDERRRYAYRRSRARGGDGSRSRRPRV